MNTFEKIIEKIKGIFKRNNQKLLTEGQQEIEQNTKTSNTNKKNLDYLKVKDPVVIPKNISITKNKEYEPGTIEDAIDQYLKGLEYNYQEGLNISSYGVLTNLFAKNGQPKGQNEQNEKLLIDKLRKNPNKYYLGVQGKYRPIFYHIKSANQEEYDENNTTRLYINVKRENIAKLSQELLEAYGNDIFYFKFLADNQLDIKNRTESVVIYEKNDKINRTLQIIEKIKKNNPQIFEESEKMTNPFNKKTLDGVVAYAPEVDGKYLDNKGKYKIVPASFNSVLSTALGESYINAAYELIKNNRDISEKLNNEFLINMEFVKNIPDIESGQGYEKKIDKALEIFANAYKYISENHSDELVQKVKQNLLNAKMRNPKLDINTRESRKIEQER